MKVITTSNSKKWETEEVVIDRLAENRRNRMRLATHYVDAKKITFYDHVGAVARVGTVEHKSNRGLGLVFRGGYKEGFFYEELLELEVKNRISVE